MIDFAKMHGTGNDFVVIGDVDNALDVPIDAVRKLCDRHFGIGADGVIRIGRGSNAQYFMDYRNADGSLAESCGNGIRVMGKWLGDRDHVDDSFDIETRGGVVSLQLLRNESGVVENVTVGMGRYSGDAPESKIEVDDFDLEGTLVDHYNPHVIFFVDDVSGIDVNRVGSRIEHHSMFPNGVNVGFASQIENGFRLRTWERGSGRTLACGTNACATAIAAHHRGLRQGGSVIEVDGGTLHIGYDTDGKVSLAGPATDVFSGSFDPVAFGIVTA